MATGNGLPDRLSRRWRDGVDPIVGSVTPPAGTIHFSRARKIRGEKGFPELQRGAPDRAPGATLRQYGWGTLPGAGR
jgi:hypothetical protein